MKTKVSSWALVLLSSMLIILVAVASGLAIANAQDDVGNVTFLENDSQENTEVVPGVLITKSDGTDVETPTDYEYNESEHQITIKTDGLHIKGTSLEEPGVNIGFVVETTCKNITVENLYLNYTGDHNVFRIKCNESTSGGDIEDIFNLIIVGKCFIYQNSDQDYNHAIFFEEGAAKGNVNIKSPDSDTYSYLECYSKNADTILSHRSPMTFTGKLETAAYVTDDNGDGDVIDWDVENENNNNLTVDQNAILIAGNQKNKADTAIVAGNINVLSSGSLYAINNNEKTSNMPTVKAKGNFYVDTDGEVIIDAYNNASWQAIICNGDMTINKCSNFVAIAKDYSAVECHSKLIIKTSNVYMSGTYIRDDDKKAHRGAFTIDDISKLEIADNILMYGNEDWCAEETAVTDRAVLSFTSGTDIYQLYSPVVCQGNNAFIVAKTVMFKSDVYDIALVPGQDATFDEAGFKDCYKAVNANKYFEDFDQTIPIENYETWKSKDGNGYIPSIGVDFNAYKDTIADQCNLMLEKSDSPEVQALIADAKSSISSYEYNDLFTEFRNKTEIDKIFEKLSADVDAIALPVPEPAPVPVPVPVPDPVNPGGGSTAQTGDNIALILFIVALLVAISLMVFFLRKRYSTIINNKVSFVRVSLCFIVTTTLAAILIPILLTWGIVFAAPVPYESDEVVYPANTSLFEKVLFSVSGYETGLIITKPDGNIAVENKDYTINDICITLLTDDLTITGSDPSLEVECRLEVTKNVKNLTLADVTINNTEDDTHALYVDCDSPDNDLVADTNFTLNIEGSVHLWQSDEHGGCGMYYANGGKHGIIVTGDSDSYLECYAKYYDAILINKDPIMFGGDITAVIYSDGDDGIQWYGEHSHGFLLLANNADITFGSSEKKRFAAIDTSYLFVVNNASLTAANYNEETRDRPAVYVERYFGVNTSGGVFIDSGNEHSWQAVKCDGDISILNASYFTAISYDYPALECHGSLNIETPHVYLYGQYLRESQGYARRGAFTIDDINKLHIIDGVSMFGSSSKQEEQDVNYRAAVTYSYGVDISEELEEIFTPIVCQDNDASKVASTVTFRGTPHNLELVPEVLPTYDNAGHKPYYICNGCAKTFADAYQQIEVFNLEEWLGPNGEGYFAPLSLDFNAYRQKMVEYCNKMFIRADTPEIRAFVKDAQDEMSLYKYNDEISLFANKGELDKIYINLYNQVKDIQP